MSTNGRPFETLDLSVLGAGDGRVWLSAHSRQGEVHGVPRTMPDFAGVLGETDPSLWFGRTVGQAMQQRTQALAIGAALRDLVFGVPEIASLLDQTRGVAADGGANLLIRLLAAPSDISAWPWELIVDPQQPDRFLVLARDAHLVRTARARTYPARQRPIAPPLHLLLVLSSPLSSGPADNDSAFDLYAEKQALLKELRPLVDKGLLLVDVEERPSIERLRSRMARQRHGFHLVHYLGHAQPSGLKLEDPLGRGRLVPSQEFSTLLQELPDLRLAVFAGCETARAPVTTAAVQWPGQLSMTDYCVRDASPAVVGMQAVLPFGTERLFTRFFYQSLTSGRSVAEALRLARLAISDDAQVGGGLLDWAVPCLFVGGSDPGPLIDPTVKAQPAPARRRASLRLDERQSDFNFFARQNELREAIDVLCGQNRCRLLQVVGGSGVGKSRLLDRAIEELDDSVARLFVSGRRLFRAEDQVLELCMLVDEVVKKAGRRTTPRGNLTAAEWWVRLLEYVADTKLAIAIDDADGLHDASAAPVVDALCLLTQRRGDARVAIATARENPALGRNLPAAAVRVIRLQPLAWPEVWQWVRRNLPVLTRYGDAALSPYFADLGAHLELWSDLSDLVSQRPTVMVSDLPALVLDVAQRLSTLPAANVTPPPLFSAAPSSAARAQSPAAVAREVERARPAAVQPLRVAIAGPHTSGRSAEFSRAVTQLAAQLGVGGRVVLSDARDSSSSLAQMLGIPSPFDAEGQATEAELLKWTEAAKAKGADVMLFDFGSAHPSPNWERVASVLSRSGTLIVAAGGNERQPCYPGWCDGVLAVGALEANGERAEYSIYDAARDKPELFASKTTDDSPFELVVAQRGQQGTSFAALHVVGAAVMVWATDRSQSVDDVREALMQSARRLPDGSRILDAQAALDRVRRQLLLDALERGPLETGELLAESGVRSELALPLMQALLDDGKLRKLTDRGSERYENTEAVYLVYEQVRREVPSKAERTEALALLLARIRRLAQRGRFEPDEVRAMWASDSPGRRVAALGAMSARAELRDFDIVLQGITASRSAFEQYESLSVATAMLDVLTPTQRTALRSSLEVQRGPDGWIKDWHDRAAIADRLLARLAGAPAVDATEAKEPVAKADAQERGAQAGTTRARRRRAP